MNESQGQDQLSDKVLRKLGQLEQEIGKAVIG